MQDDIVLITKVRYVRITGGQRLNNRNSFSPSTENRFLNCRRSHTFWKKLSKASQIHRFESFPFVLRLPGSLTLITQEKNNNRLATTSPWSVFVTRIVAAIKTGPFGRGTGGHGRVDVAWNRINKWKIPSLWLECSRARERPVVMPQWGTPVRL